MQRTLGRIVAFVMAFLATSAAAQPASDEQQLRDIQQGLAQAWLQKDRANIETVLGREWSVGQVGGSLLTRATVLGPFFEGVQPR